MHPASRVDRAAGQSPQTLNVQGARDLRRSGSAVREVSSGHGIVTEEARSELTSLRERGYCSKNDPACACKPLVSR
eukprot:2548055-Rhodomonas_salina.1